MSGKKIFKKMIPCTITGKAGALFDTKTINNHRLSGVPAMKKSFILLVFLMPLCLIALMKLCPAPAAPIPAEKKMSASEERAIAAEERRAERAAAREARKAERAAKTSAVQQNMAPDFGGMSFGEFPAFDPNMSFDNSMAMAPGMGFGGGFGGMPGMGFGGGFGGF